MARRWRPLLEWPPAAFASVVAVLQSWGVVNALLAYEQGALGSDTVYAAAVALVVGAGGMTGPLVVAALRGGLTARRAGRAVATAVATGLACGLPATLVSLADSAYRSSHDFAPPQGGLIPLLESVTLPLLFLTPPLALGAGALVLLPAPPGSARGRILTLLLVGVPVSVLGGLVGLVAAVLVLRTGEPWSGFNHGVVAGSWVMATVLLSTLDRHARFLRRAASRASGGEHQEEVAGFH